MSKLMKKMVSIGLAFVMLVCTTCGNITNVQAATKGNTESGVYCTVKISSNLLAKKGRQYATVKLSTYSKW